jgi:hypothetical protein
VPRILVAIAGFDPGVHGAVPACRRRQCPRSAKREDTTILHATNKICIAEPLAAAVRKRLG